MTVECPLVVAVVLNWNQPGLTLECLRSLAAQDYSNCRPLVVDNGSADDSVARIRAASPSLELIENAENLGYAGGNNVGLRRALALGAKYVLVLNNDVRLAPDTVSLLVRVMEADPSVGMAGPSVFFDDGSGTLFSQGSTVEWAAGTTHHLGLGTTPPVEAGRAATAIDADFLVGCAVCVRRETLEAVGPLEERYHLNFEDVEWGVRAKALGRRVVCVPGAAGWHKVSSTLGLASPTNTYYMTRNSLLFFSRNGSALTRPLAVTRIALRTLRTVGAWSLKPKYRTDAFRRKRDANLYALRDFCLGRFGRMGQVVARVNQGFRAEK